MISKLLIANRGEIAVRIEQTCREMGICTVAVYSAADDNALHVQMADEALPIGEAPARDSYLNVAAILGAARESGADAVHPGYGFLAENPAFAAAVEEAGLIWVGPPASVIALMGDKTAAKRLAASAGVPIVPGYYGESQTVDAMLTEAEDVGYPLLVKAVAGGGGKGMRSVASPAELPAALESARREAKSAFGDDRVFLEKLVSRPRHIEIQIVADAFGNVVSLGERDCSLQRRHQKIIEETPSPVMTPELRAAMGMAAIRLVRAAGYVNAGTVEFLFSADSFYFLEMNTRIQVEHPVTELVADVDIVRLQLDIAAAAPLPLAQLDVRLDGHAIEARLYAEDASAGFLPSTGRLEIFRPPDGVGIRNDVGVFAGAEVTPYYDPMLAKLIVHAADREEAVSRLQDALRRYAVAGVATNLEFLNWLSSQQTFTSGRADVEFVDRTWHPTSERELPLDALVAAAAFDSVDPHRHQVDGRRNIFNPWEGRSGWRQVGAVRSLTYTSGARAYEVRVEPMDGRLKITCEGECREVLPRPGAPGTLILLDGVNVLRFMVSEIGSRMQVTYDGRTYIVERPGSAVEGGSGAGGRGGGLAGLSAPMPGTVVKVAVTKGQRVDAHQPLVMLEAMKMEHTIHAPHAGVVKSVHFREGDMVPAGAPLVEMEAL